jgi:hypothetical protein
VQQHETQRSAKTEAMSEMRIRVMGTWVFVEEVKTQAMIAAGELIS